MHDRRLLQLSLALMLPLSGCALIGYDLGSDANPAGGSGNSGGGSRVTPPGAGTGARDGGSSSTGTADGGGAGSGSAAGASGSAGGGAAGTASDAGTRDDAGSSRDAGDAGDDMCRGMPDGTMCDDGLYCQTADVCVGGVCTPSGPKNCDLVAGAGECNASMCSEDLD